LWRPQTPCSCPCRRNHKRLATLAQVCSRAFSTGFSSESSRAAPISETAPAGKSKVEVVLGQEFLKSLAGKTVIDFGCGEGAEAVDMAGFGARRVVGLDFRENVLETARQKAKSAGLETVCHFAQTTGEVADVIVSIDAFEHFDDPNAILRTMDTLLKPDGAIMAVFGPTWYHPLGGHSFSVFPWSHLLFSEEALLRWRSDFRPEGATRFGEVGGGLNQITIGKFEKVVRDSPFEFASFEAVPIRKLRRLHNAWTREFFSAIVRCRLVKKAALAALTVTGCRGFETIVCNICAALPVLFIATYPLSRSLRCAPCCRRWPGVGRMQRVSSPGREPVLVTGVSRFST
jgi:SAM-dependent methyltransferase